GSMGNLFGHKRWYEVRDKKDFKIKRKVKVKRNYDGNKYILNINENNNKEKIDNNKFIRKYINYKKNDNILKEFTRKFHAGNILFKLKGKEGIIRIENNDDFLETEEVVLYIEAYGKSEKLKALGITKKKIIDEAIRQGITKDDKKIEIKRQENEEEIEIDIRDEYTNKTLNDCSIILRIIENDELETKKSIYEIFKNINMSLYKIIEKIIENETEKVFENRYYEEHLREKLLKDDKIDVILTNFMEIREKIKSNLEILGFVKFYLNVGGDKKKSKNKKMLVEKILNINVDLTVEDIADFVIKELEFWNITKRIEKVKKVNNEFLEKRRNRTYIKSYVLLDKHEKFKIERENKKDKIVKFFVENIKNNSIKEKIEKILAEFKIDELIKKLEKELKKGNCDTEIFGIFKKHYKVNFDSKKFSKKSDEEKELYKIIYRYLKGRIEKILVNEQKVRLKKMEKIEIEKILNESILSEKILKRVKQYTLEHIMYLGKLRHNDIDMTTVNTDDFSRLHAKEELDLELITFFASTNMELNKIFSRENINNDENIDFFGGDREKNYVLDKKILNSKIKIIRDLDFIDNKNNITNNFIRKFTKIGTNERNRILHAISKERDLQGTQDDYNKVINIIQNLKISDEEVSKALNLDVVFKDKKNIITKINDIKISEENNNDIKYLPSFSKVLPEILNLYRNNPKNEPFDTIETEKIVLNALIYVNKELYKKLILEDDLEENESKNIFLQELKKTLGNIDEIDENIIENYYKNAQISASKGNNKAIKKYQKKVIECYIGYLRKNYEELFDFSDFKMNIQEIKKQIKDINDNKTYERITVKTSDKTIVINDDFEYIISIFALLNSNAVINKIRNRFFATSVWLNTSEYQNIIDILDEIMQLNTLRNECITENWNLNLEEFIQKMKEIEKDFDDFKIQTKKEIFNNYYEDIKNNILTEFKDDINGCDVLEKKLEKIVIFDDETKFEIDKKSNILQDEQRKLSNINKKDLKKKVDQYIKDKDQEIKSKILCRIIFNSDFLKKYKKEIDNLIEDMESENENKFQEIYYPKERKNELYIYKKNLFLNIGNPNFDKIYGLISNDIKMADAKFLFNIDGKNIRKNKISEIDAILKNLNDKLNGYSKEYKEKYIKKLKENDDFFAKNIQNKNYKSFEKDYNRVSEYKKIRDLVEFNYLNKIESYLIDINWKLAIQMARFERDMHYIVNGLRELGIIKLSGYNTGISRAYPKRNGSDGFYTTTAYYKFFDEESYKKFEKICYGFGIDLSENSEINKPENESIRNYISHFYIVRNPFADYSIAEQIDRVSNLLSYSTRYNNSTYASVFEVFKKDVNLDYDELKKKFKLIGNNDILERLMKPKKVSVLELESYNSDYIKNLIIELLTKIENTNDTL
uniref:CRISPR/Cas system Cas13a n=1 Tax=Leptotrichia shahii TaxID=157691 RepID=UPI00193116ED|nr:Chain A, CRISPR/Cas system Cas13a [Leptotrichia shahii]